MLPTPPTRSALGPRQLLRLPRVGPLLAPLPTVDGVDDGNETLLNSSSFLPLTQSCMAFTSGSHAYEAGSWIRSIFFNACRVSNTSLRPRSIFSHDLTHVILRPLRQDNLCSPKIQQTNFQNAYLQGEPETTRKRARRTAAIIARMGASSLIQAPPLGYHLW